LNLSKFAVNRPVTITMIVLMVIVIGIVSLTGLPIDLFPEIEIPVAIVSTTYSGAGPQEMENLVTDRIESAIATVGNIDKVNSISSQGNSVVIAQFNFGTDMDFATLEMREKVDLVKRALPTDADQPMVIKLDPNAAPIMQISLSGGNGLESLQTLAEDTFEQRLERIEGVASVDTSGGLVEEIRVVVNPWELAEYGLSMDRVSQSLAATNLSLPGGTVNDGSEELSIRVVGEFESVEDIKTLPIALQSGGMITIEDIAEVELTNSDITSMSRTNGKDSINVSVQKQSGQNTVEVADQIHKEVDKLIEEYPDIDIQIVMDTSEFITDSINSVVNNVLMGAIFAIIVLYIFLRNIRTTLIIGVAIPISFIASLILLYLNDITLNMMTLGGLALAAGMLVDSAIVVLENIYRYRSEGYSRQEAAIEGAGEVGMSITASTLTTVAVFLPIMFVEGMVGILFKDFALTVTLALGASLLVALTFIPMLSSEFLKVDSVSAFGDGTKKKRKLDFIYNAFDKVYEKVENGYSKVLNYALGHRKSTILLSIVIFIVSVASMFGVGMEFFPTSDEGAISVNVELPLGSQVEEVDEVIKDIEAELENIAEIEIVFANVGGGGGMSATGSTSHTGSVSANLVDLKDRDRSTAEVAEEIRGYLKDVPGADITVDEASSMGAGMGGAGSPVSIKIKGSDLDILKDISNDFKDIIQSVEGTRDVNTSLSDAIDELEVSVDRQKAAKNGLTTSQIASAVRTATSGSTVTKYREDGEETDIIIRGREDVKERLANVERLNINTPSGVNISLSQVADISIVKGPIEINREDQERTVTVNSQITGRDLDSVTREIDSKLQEYVLPDTYVYDIGGEQEQMMDAFGQLILALLLAIVLIYMVMAAQFESLIYPFIIMFTIPLAFAGGALALFITRSSFGVTAFIGIIMLAGIVVNNGIVLIDYINILRKRGQDKYEAIKTAGKVRLRPILMTTLTTVLGLLPLALGIGVGAETQQPMAIVVIGGLMFSTVLTLVFVPILYTIFDNISNALMAKLKKTENSDV
jgi:hydrophobic/amphiphilic exporter-1 (mainly G- bacteria), HAE1 family